MKGQLVAGWSHPDEFLRIENEVASGPGDAPVRDNGGPQDGEEASVEDFLAADPPDAFLRLLAQDYTPEEKLRRFERMLKSAPSHEMFLMGEWLVTELNCTHPGRAKMHAELERILEDQLEEKLRERAAAAT